MHDEREYAIGGSAGLFFRFAPGRLPHPQPSARPRSAETTPPFIAEGCSLVRHRGWYESGHFRDNSSRGFDFFGSPSVEPRRNIRICFYSPFTFASVAVVASAEAAIRNLSSYLQELII